MVIITKIQVGGLAWVGGWICGCMFASVCVCGGWVGGH